MVGSNAFQDKDGGARVFKEVHEHLARELSKAGMVPPDCPLLSILNASAVPSLIFAADGGIVSINDAMRQLIGDSLLSFEAIGDWLSWLCPQPEQLQMIAGFLSEGFTGQAVIECTATVQSGTDRAGNYSLAIARVNGLGLVHLLPSDARRTAAQSGRLNGSEAPSTPLVGAAGVAWCAVHGVAVIEANEKFSALIGASRENLVNRTFNSLFPSSESNKVMRLYELVLTGQIPSISFKTEILHQSGASIPVELTIRQEELANGLGIIWLVEETPRQAPTELNLQAFKVICDKAGYGVGIVDSDMKFVYLNEYFARIHGFEPQELMGKHISVFHDPTQLAIVMDILEHVRNIGFAEMVMVPHRRHDGSVFPTLMNIAAIGDGTGGKPYFAATAIDMSDLTKTRKALSESEQRYRTLFDSAPLGIISCAPDGAIRDVNAKLLQIMGSPSEEATKAINVLKFPRLVEAGISASMRQCLESGQPLISEHQYVSKWSKASHLRFYLAPLFHPDQTVRGLLAIVEDLTESEEIKAELQSKKRLADIGEDIASLGHHMKNIQLALDGGVYLLTEKLTDTKDLELMEASQIIQRSSANLFLLLMNILDYTKHRRHNKSFVSLEPLLQNIASQLNAIGIKYQVGCRLSIESPDQTLFVDEELLRRSLLNLGVNALQASPPNSSITIQMQRIPVSELGNRLQFTSNVPQLDPLVIRVIDHGVGIKSELMDKIFQPFFSTKGGDGSGLGLPAVKQFIDEHGGNILIESTVGVGSTFSLVFPVDVE